MKYEAMKNRPKSRREFERNLNYLAEALHTNTFHITPNCNYLIEDIPKVRALPNGRIDFSTVSESVRLSANTITEMDCNKNKNV